MKLTPKLKSKKTLLLLLPLTLLALVVWNLGPLLIIAKHVPLQDPRKRLALILTFYLAWLVKFFLLDQATAPAAPNKQDVTHLLHALRGRFLGALKFLKKTIIDKHGFATPLNKLPWYLLIGPPGSGKTTLLAYSSINYILSKQYKPEGQDKGITASSVCDWWVTRDLVIVDVPGCYTFSPPQDPILDARENKETLGHTKPHIHLSLWKSLLQLLTKYRQKNNIGAIIIALQLPELMRQSRQQQTQWFQEMKDRLSESWNKFGKVPVYFIITKCDLMPGFSEFFNDIGSDELIQPWGIPLSARKDHEGLLEAFTLRFNALIKRLNKQLIWRMHLERNAQLRPLIKDFPLQLEFLKETLTHLIKMLLAVNPDLDLEGIYLTSASQINNSTSASTLFHHDVPSELQLASPTPFVSRAYFVKNIISYLLPHTSQHLAERLLQKKSRLPKIGYSLGFTFLLLGALWFGHDYQRGIYQISTLQRYLSQFQLYVLQNNPQNTPITSISSALPLLNTLEAAAQPGVSRSRLQRMETYYSDKSQQTTVAIYRKALQTIIMPQIRNEFEKYLQSSEDKNPEQVYVALKAYLMLRQQDPKSSNSTQVNFILNTLKEISPLLNKNPINQELGRHIQNALKTKQANTLDNKLIRQIRKRLNSLPSDELAYILLKHLNNQQDTEINLGTNIGTPPALVSKGTVTVIPQMFTAPAFAAILKDEIPLAARDAIQGNEVLGRKLVPTDALVPDSVLIMTLTEKLEKSYVSHYIDIWESLVDNISINSPKNLTETDAMILNLISSHSPLLQLLQTIHTNTNLDPVLSSSYRLQALNTLFDQTQTKQKDSLFEIFVDLHQLHLYIQQAGATAPSKDKLADPSQLIRAKADKYPEPIKNWLLTLISSTQTQLQAELKPNPAAESKPVLVKNTPAPLPTPRLPVSQPKKILAPQPPAADLAEKDDMADVIEKRLELGQQTPTEPSLIKKKFKQASSSKGGYMRVRPDKQDA